MNVKNRPCQVCGSSEHKVLFHQNFSKLSSGSLLAGYDLCLCQKCGFAFAGDLPPAEEFDRYYGEMSKYEQSDRGGMPSPVDQERYRQTADLIVPHVKKHERVVDVGCATGGLLAEFKRRGYDNLLGFDPSPACAEAAKRLFGIEVRPASINGLDQGREQFDVMILTGVFEHLCDVNESISSLVKLLTPGARLYLEVPDATSYSKWFSAPFQFFSMEHVNYFSPRSLVNLLGQHGFECAFAEQVVRYLGPRAVEPAVAALFSFSKKTRGVVRDEDTEPALLEYIARSRSLEARIQSVISQLVESRVPLAVWGVGTHTLRLLETSALPQAGLVAFLDSNTRYQGKKLSGVPILAPDQFHDRNATILISSHVAEAEIKELIQNRLHWPNKVVCLYEGVPLKL